MGTFWRSVETPVGTVLLAVDADHRVRAEFTALHDEPPVGRQDPGLLPEAAAWLTACLRERVGPPPIPVPAASSFRRRCWLACRDIPVGETRTYTLLASMAGNGRAARAAGSAMRNNPMSLLTPCHRVVAANGWGGYAGRVGSDTPSLRLKRRILELERVIAS
jgi:O-6-methylguanine DNA methyltransferase